MSEKVVERIGSPKIRALDISWQYENNNSIMYTANYARFADEMVRGKRKKPDKTNLLRFVLL